MPPLQGVLEASLYVDDLERSARFYQEVFGFAVIHSGDRLRAVRVTDRQVLLLFKKGASADHDGEGRLHLAFAIVPEALQAWERWLPEHGVVIESRKAWPRGGHSIYFRDPDQHLLELVTPGCWSIY
jgi:catechol 2,3-dioxygenase-like lactoylglutathione lyase family enzyme